VIVGQAVDSRHNRRLMPPAGARVEDFQVVGLFNGRNRRPVAVAITTDGRRVQLPLNDSGILDVSLLSLIRSLLVGLEDLLGLITGSRRENGGSRRIERR
jgi:hypothetical protein